MKSKGIRPSTLLSLSLTLCPPVQGGGGGEKKEESERDAETLALLRKSAIAIAKNGAAWR